MVERDGQYRDLRSFVVLRGGPLLETRNAWEPYRLLDPAGVVEPVAVYLKHLPDIGRPATTQRCGLFVLSQVVDPVGGQLGEAFVTGTGLHRDGVRF
ncbi:hypothetical protein [Streptomyces sp. TLI_146]|uniref:hypothetical protein n=1 Tax=Streptomyces sp. TLI_146 TaxID=1938858 RepID=UPI000C7158E5|nr:hypothetical protein [Streptomyces sp. TLI_146]PKV82973.1 hypothetical protein BX283_0456 [Streptomyces sp. TLI_146]